jgi:hypothetical protein
VGERGEERMKQASTWEREEKREWSKRIATRPPQAGEDALPRLPFAAGPFSPAHTPAAPTRNNGGVWFVAEPSLARIPEPGSWWSGLCETMVVRLVACFCPARLQMEVVWLVVRYHVAWDEKLKIIIITIFILYECSLISLNLPYQVLIKFKKH